MGVEEAPAGTSTTFAFAMAAPEGSVTCPRKTPEAGGPAAVCDAARVTHNCSQNTRDARRKYLRPFISFFSFCNIEMIVGVIFDAAFAWERASSTDPRGLQRARPGSRAQASWPERRWERLGIRCKSGAPPERPTIPFLPRAIPRSTAAPGGTGSALFSLVVWPFSE